MNLRGRGWCGGEQEVEEEEEEEKVEMKDVKEEIGDGMKRRATNLPKPQVLSKAPNNQHAWLL